MMRNSGVAFLGLALLMISPQCTLSRQAPPEPSVRQATGALAEWESEYAARIEPLLAPMGAPQIPDRREPQQIFEAMCLEASRPGAEIQRVALCTVITARLDPSVAQPARVWMLRQLERISGRESVAALARLLDDDDPHIRELARRALQGNPAPEAGSTLQTALSRARGPAQQVAFINALAGRGDTTSVPVLLSLVHAKDRAVATAAISALGTLGGPRAVDTLSALTRSEDEVLRDSAEAALIRIADRLLEAGRREPAVAIYEDLDRASAGRSNRVAAWRGFVAARGQEALPRLREIMRNEADPALRQIAARLAQGIPGERATRLLVGELATAPDDVQIVVLDVLAARGDRPAKPSVLDVLRSDDQHVRIAALDALAQLGDAHDVIRLAGIAAGAGDSERAAARTALDRLRGTGVDRAILAGVGGEEPPEVRAELIRSLGARGYRPAVETLLRTAEETSETVRVAAFDALGRLADEGDLPVVIGLVADQTTEAARRAVQDAIVSLCLRIDDPDRRAEPVLAALGDASGAAKASLIHVLGRLGGPGALAAIRAALADEADIQDAAVRALAGWNDATVLDDLLSIARTDVSQAHRVLVLRAYVRLVRLPSQRSAPQTCDLLRQAMALAPQDDVRKLVLGALGEVACVDALDMAGAHLGDEALCNEAAVAVASIARKIAGWERGLAVDALRHALDANIADAARQQVQEVVDLIDRFDGYIGTWRVTGPYLLDDREWTEVFDSAFPPEAPDAGDVDWQALEAAEDDNPWIFDLRKLDTRRDRCVYVRAGVWSDSARPARLEIGSDDGVKAWLNGELVHSLATVRSVTPGEDKVNVDLRQGWNVLLLKIVQASGGWGFACAIRDREGNPFEDVKFRAE
ncbi:MAG: HEAT repeat domain-containing protein [Phycisphaerales bacterium]|nr:MAG: HEAT repeat domain-containing protein [Phycisphaerales bacterium]